jgi:hypothetical protein
MALALLLVFAPVIFGGKTLLPTDQLNTMMLPFSEQYDSVDVYNHFLTDAVAQVYPYKVRWRENALRGEFASWNPSLFGGHPHYASTSFTHFDPTNVLLLLPLPLLTAYHTQLLAKLLIAGIAMWLLLGYFSVSGGASSGASSGASIHPVLRAMFATAYMLNSLFITTLQHQWVLGVFCWMPLAVLFLLRFVDARRLYDAALASVFLALGFLGGSLQTNVVALLLFSTVGVVRLWQEFRETGEKRFSLVLTLVLVITTAFALSAVMWLPSVELFLYNINIRADGKAFSVVNSLKSLPLLVSFAIPELLGTVRGFDLAKIAQADMNDFNAFVGFAPFVFGVFGAFAMWRTNTALRAFVVLMTLGLAIPLFTPLYKFLYHRTFIVYVFGLTVTGAIAAHECLFGEHSDMLRKRFYQFLRWAFIGLGVIAALVIVGNVVLAWKYDVIHAKATEFVMKNIASSQLAAGSEAWMLGRVDVFLNHFSLTKPSQFPQMWLALLFPLVVLLVVRGVAGLNHKPTLQSALLLALTVGQVWLYAHAWLPMIDTAKYPLYPPTHTTDALRRDTTLYRILPLFDAKSQRVMQPNINDMYGVSCIQGYESIFPYNVSQLAPPLGNGIPTGMPQIPPTHDILLGGLGNVKYYVASAKNPLQHSALRVVDSGATVVYENLLCEPRAFMRYRYNVLPATQQRLFVQQPAIAAYTNALTDSTFTGETVLLWREPDVKISMDSVIVRDVPNRVRITNYENNRVRIAVESAEAGYLVLSDTYYPGWKAWVNGNEQAIMRANFAMRSLTVPRGSSVVEFRFDPPLFRIGAWMSGSALVLVLCVGMVSVWRRGIQ